MNRNECQNQNECQSLNDAHRTVVPQGKQPIYPPGKWGRPNAPLRSTAVQGQQPITMGGGGRLQQEGDGERWVPRGQGVVGGTAHHRVWRGRGGRPAVEGLGGGQQGRGRGGNRGRGRGRRPPTALLGTARTAGRSVEAAPGDDLQWGGGGGCRDGMGQFGGPRPHLTRNGVANIRRVASRSAGRKSPRREGRPGGRGPHLEVLDDGGGGVGQAAATALLPHRPPPPNLPYSPHGRAQRRRWVWRGWRTTCSTTWAPTPVSCTGRRAPGTAGGGAACQPSY